jgi:hypothetical protein
MTKGTVLCSSKKQRRRPEPRGARLACSTGEKAGLNYTADSRSNIRGARSQWKREVTGRRKISLRLCSQNPKQQISCSTTEARKNGFRLSGSLCACSKQRLNNERLGAQNHHQTDVPKSKAGSRICETGHSKTETRHGKSGAGGRIETAGTSCETGHTKTETRHGKSGRTRHNSGAASGRKKNRKTGGAPAGESCRKKAAAAGSPREAGPRTARLRAKAVRNKKRRRRAVDKN